MVIVMQSGVAEDAALLTRLETDHILSFCEISIWFLELKPTRSIEADIKKTLKKRVNKVAKKLEETPDDVEHSLLALANLFISAAKNRLNQSRFNFSLKHLGLSEDRIKVIAEFYSQNAEKLRCVVTESSDLGLIYYNGVIPEYVDFRWRLDVEVACRTLKVRVGYIISLLHVFIMQIY
mmetsp:Transcript_15011/g.17556  ORF Transcript_15011/g.17556 Transcript_15011/m.17556 type:complete len:179 (+) Transcript_15011:105-641(+)